MPQRADSWQVEPEPASGYPVLHASTCLPILAEVAHHMSEHLPVRGVIFDLDGTLVDSALDFDLMRSEMGLAPGQPILEALGRLSPEAAAPLHEVLHRHEWEGAHRATLMPGVKEMLQQLQQRGILLALLTRNSRRVTQATLARFELIFDPVIAREDAAAKPSPEGLLKICRHWDLAPAQTLMVGDYLYDIQAGQAAGMRTALYTAGLSPEACGFHHEADLIITDFRHCAPFWQLFG